MQTLSTARRATTQALSGLDFAGTCFETATNAAHAKILSIPARERTAAQKRDCRRIADKARRLEAV